MEKDLLGRKVKRRRSNLEVRLDRHDRSSFEHRLARLKWLSRVFPTNFSFIAPPETVFIFDEVRNTFVDGAYIGTVLLCSSFIEHWLAALLRYRGFEAEARAGLRSIIKCMKREHLAHDFLIKRVERLRRLRNPFAHLKPFEDSNTISQRSFVVAKDPMVVLEDDAKFAVSLMYAVASKIH